MTLADFFDGYSSLRLGANSSSRVWDLGLSILWALHRTTQRSLICLERVRRLKVSSLPSLT